MDVNEAEEAFTDLALDMLPSETLFDIIIQMDIRSITSLCRSNKSRFSEFCNDDYLWMKLLERDYPNFLIVGDPRKHYMNIYESKGNEYPYQLTINDAMQIMIPGNQYPAGTRAYRLYSRIQIYDLVADGWSTRYTAFEYFFNLDNQQLEDIRDDLSDELYSMLIEIDDNEEVSIFPARIDIRWQVTSNPQADRILPHRLIDHDNDINTREDFRDYFSQGIYQFLKPNTDLIFDMQDPVFDPNGPGYRIIVTLIEILI
jgi:hypothetical protein